MPLEVASTMGSKYAFFERLTLHTPYLSQVLSLPPFLYGTAWKKDRTADLVFDALKNGFTAIDTAAQPKHYRENLVSEGLKRAIREKVVARSEIFVQTKFTSINGQDPKNMPYQVGVSLAQQVRDSIESSLRNFSMEDVPTVENDRQPYLDSVILHSPLETFSDTLEVWRALESFVPRYVLSLGISNVDLAVLEYIYENASIKPTIVQNRFYAGTNYDVALRTFCGKKGIVYQSFWTLSANPGLLKSEPVQNLQSTLDISAESALYGLVLGLGDTVILNGTTNVSHMKADWEMIDRLRDYAQSDASRWEKNVAHLKRLIGQV